MHDPSLACPCPGLTAQTSLHLRGTAPYQSDVVAPGAQQVADEEDEEDEEEEEVPEDLASLTPEQQQRRIKLRSAWMMGLGTVLVLLFSDPMVSQGREWGGGVIAAVWGVARAGTWTP